MGYCDISQYLREAGKRYQKINCIYNKILIDIRQHSYFIVFTAITTYTLIS